MDMAGIVVLLLSVIATRILDESAVRSLDDAQRTLIAERFVRSRAIGLLPLLGLAAIYALVAPRVPEHAGLLGLVCGGLAAVLVGVLHVQGVRKLREAGLPAAYVRAWNVSRAVQYGGMIAAVALLAVGKLGLG